MKRFLLVLAAVTLLGSSMLSGRLNCACGQLSNALTLNCGKPAFLPMICDPLGMVFMMNGRQAAHSEFNKHSKNSSEF
jgi:hypothetical protein